MLKKIIIGRMKAGNIAILLNNMSAFEFWVFMKMPLKKRQQILVSKARKIIKQGGSFIRC